MIVVQNVCTKLVTLVLSCSTWVYRDTYSDLESCHNSHSTCILAQEQLAMLSALGRDFAPRNRDWSCWNPKGALGNVNSNQNPNKVRSVMVIACYVFFSTARRFFMVLDCSCILSFESFGDPEVQDQTPDSCCILYCEICIISNLFVYHTFQYFSLMFDLIVHSYAECFQLVIFGHFLWQWRPCVTWYSRPFWRPRGCKHDSISE